ncbi:MAG: formylglycine-generating enzyme family protein [Rhodospirillaceae bacterium]
MRISNIFPDGRTRRRAARAAAAAIFMGVLAAVLAGPALAQISTKEYEKRLKTWKPRPPSAEALAVKSFTDCPTCPEMVVVPKGVFVMGSDLDNREQPKHSVFIKKPFAISRYEITFDEWDACLKEGGCDHNPHDHGWGRGRQPVVNIDFHMAQGFAEWLSKKTGKPYRLPSEAEWEYAARAGTKTNYWFGDDAGVGRINCRKCGTPWSDHRNAPVGMTEPNPFGIYDMHGNAYEWVADCWAKNYEGAPRDGSARKDGNCKIRVIRGGSWYYFARQARSSSRAKNDANVNSYWLSFRVVLEPEDAALTERMPAAPAPKTPAPTTPGPKIPAPPPLKK